MLSILQTELFQVCSCLGNLHAVEPGLQPELLNHLLHGGDARRTRHGKKPQQLTIQGLRQGPLSNRCALTPVLFVTGVFAPSGSYPIPGRKRGPSAPHVLGSPEPQLTGPPLLEGSWEEKHPSR